MKKAVSRRNPVARNAGRFNRAATFRDRSKYSRKPKHRGREPFAVPTPAAGTAKGVAVRTAVPGG